LLAIAALFLPFQLFADGKVFPPLALPAHVTIPDQRALIHFTNGTERLVIETRFTGSGTNFAWVVPLPGRPVIEEASTGLFPTLQHLFRPRFEHTVTRYYLGILALLGAGYLLLFVRPDSRLNWLDLAACALVGIAVGIGSDGPLLGLIPFSLLVCGVMLVRFVTSSVVALVVVVAVVVAVGVLLPGLAKARSGSMDASSGSDGIEILNRQVVGVFETTTIASRDPKALQIWLRGNGFAMSTNAAPVIESYVKDGWIFVAAKVWRDTAGEATSTPHPLSFTFATDKPVYPMRLTGVDNGSLSVELYVFGPGRAEARHFNVERCTEPSYPSAEESWSYWSPERPRIRHPLLRRWVNGAPVATKLSARLGPADMRDDIWLEWASFREKRSVVYSRLGAFTVALNWGAAMIVLGLLGVCVADRAGSRWPARLPKLLAGTAVSGLMLFGLIYLALPKTDVRLVKRPWADAMQNLLQLYFELQDSSTNQPTIVEARAFLNSPTNGISGSIRVNPWSGSRIREEDSPGNYSLRATSDGLKYIAHDAEGAEHSIGRVVPSSASIIPDCRINPAFLLTVVYRPNMRPDLGSVRSP